MTVLIPAGTIHAIGADCLVFEIQQFPDRGNALATAWHRLTTTLPSQGPGESR
jgi:hypothetical protein